MMSNNKILTVSYGTFSCTLEGFDDSFGTMKAIAEYFRDLASDDRYFGAEPPQPDAEMLQRIAEREISRRVEAREHQGKIFLSAADPEADAAADTSAQQSVQDDEAERAARAQKEADAEIARVQEERAAQGRADAEAQRQAEEQAAAEAAAKAEARAKREAKFKAKKKAKAKRKAQAKLERIERTNADDRNASIDASVKIPVPTVSSPLEVPASDADDIDLSALIAHADATDTPRNPRDLATELPEAEAFFAGADVDGGETAETDGDAGDNSIAAKLDRIRAVVSQTESAADDEDDYLEDEHADEVAAREATAQAAVEDNPVTADALSDIEAALAADDAAEQIETSETASLSQDVDADDDDVASILAALDDDDNDADSDDDTALNLFDANEDAKAEAEAEAAPAEQPRRIARVVKVKRADLEAAIEQGELEEIDGDDDYESTLSDDDEAELARELAAVTAEVASDAEPQDDEGEMPAHALPGVQALASIDDENSDDLSRLMAQADEHMDEEEGAQRRDAFAHLRAAVAAKKADDGLGSVDPEKEEGAYRDDLATVVRPRRPSAGGARSARPDQTERPAPLKLVAEQRVDAETADSRGPVRPRRVAAVQEAVSVDPDAENFAEFAEEMGANTLSDLLEAAAAYMSFVEGREQFSRPQLMTKVRQVEKDEFSREDGLRSFGKLLRAGKIEKLKGGRFAVTGDIGFRPDARAAS